MERVDRISDLPPNVTEHILQFVTLKDLVRTSLLSTQWRYKWLFFPQLILDISFFNSVLKLSYGTPYCRMKSYRRENDNSSVSLDSRMLEYSSIVNNILVPHNGPIQKIVLYIPSWFSHHQNISHWIRFLSEKSVHEFTLGNMSGNHRKLPVWMFSCVGFANLTYLTLIDLILPSISSTSTGFPCLVTLTLRQNFIEDANKVGILVSKCPLLENLYLKIVDEKGLLNITAPRLQNFVVEGKLFDILFKETKMIKTLCLLCELGHKWIQATELFTGLPLMKKLVLDFDFWLALDTSIGECCFENLTSATIFIKSSKVALQLIKLILSTAPVLEVMTIEVSVKGEESMNFAKELLRYPRISTAEIIFNTHPINTRVGIPEPPQWSKYADKPEVVLNK